MLSMKSKNINPVTLVAALGGMALFMGCNSDPDSPGREYMPDMYRSPAIEAYVDYGQDPYYFGDSTAMAQRNTTSARLPVDGTIVFRATRPMPPITSHIPTPTPRKDMSRPDVSCTAPFP